MVEQLRWSLGHVTFYLISFWIRIGLENDSAGLFLTNHMQIGCMWGLQIKNEMNESEDSTYTCEKVRCLKCKTAKQYTQVNSAHLTRETK